METFVVRLWSSVEPGAVEPGGAPALHGVVEHVGSGCTVTFKGPEELLESLSGLAGGEISAHRAQPQPSGD